MPGQLFTNYFLEEGILRTRAWQQSLSQPAYFESFRAQTHARLENAAAFHTINEAATEQELIRPEDIDMPQPGWRRFIPAFTLAHICGDPFAFDAHLCPSREIIGLV